MSANPLPPKEALFEQAALKHWQDLGVELRADVEAFNRRGGAASFSQIGPNEYRVSNPSSGLEVTIVADPYDHMVRYDFGQTGGASAGVPEGGILSMRVADAGVQFYSSDQPVTAQEARSLLLDPVLGVKSK